MQTSSSPRALTQQEADYQMVDWLRTKMAAKFAEDGPSRRYSDALIARFAELIENQFMFKRVLGTVEDAHKLAMHQMQFAQSALRQLERQLETLEQTPNRNGKTLAAPVDLKGE